jgi:precorrin-6Y C5,15-methyltransferase (decarboxylating)
MNKVYIIGVGDNGRVSLGAEALQRIHEADLLCGGERLLAFFPESKAEKFPIRSNLKELAQRVSQNLATKQIVVLASGDPLFYGVAKYLLANISKEKVEVLPNVSSMQLAFAKVKENWEDALLVSLHARPMAEVIDQVASARKVGLFTDDTNTPARIAEGLLKRGARDFEAYVCENLGGEDERVVKGSLPEMRERKFSPLNVMILVRNGASSDPPAERDEKTWLFGIPDDEFEKKMPKKGLITKSEVRVISLSKMHLSESSVVWDIGAGSGSVAIEAARIARKGKVFAIEKNEDSIPIIRENLGRFGVRNVTVLQAKAPQGLETFDDPDAVFVGGSGSEMASILRVAASRLRPQGSIVVNAATIENLGQAVAALKELGWEVDVTLVEIARSQPILDLTRFEALNPVFVITGRKRAREGSHD